MVKKIIKWWRSLCMLHEWSKWEQYEERGTAYPGLLGKNIPAEGVPYSDTRQRRKCERCGKMQDELVR